MGYRSDVVIAVKDVVAPKVLTAHCEDGSHFKLVKDGWTLYRFNAVKWYESDECVSDIEEALVSMEEENYYFTVLGEEGDYEERGAGLNMEDFPFSVYPNRQIIVTSDTYDSEMEDVLADLMFEIKHGKKTKLNQLREFVKSYPELFVNS